MIVNLKKKKMPEKIPTGDLESEEEEEEDPEVADPLQLPECDQEKVVKDELRRLSALPARGLPSLNGTTFRLSSSQQSASSRHLRITLYVNGDRHFPGRPYVINLDRIKTLDLLCAELSRLLVSVKSLPSGVRYILDIDTGAAVEEVGELACGGGHYAVSSTVRLVKTFNYRSLNLLQRHLAAAHSSALDVPPFYHPDSTIFSAKNAQRHENLLTRSTGAVSGQQYSSSNYHHHHKSAVFGLHHLSNSAHLPSSGHRTGHSKHVTSSSNGSSSLTLSASLSIYSNYGGYTGGISSSLRPKIVALLRGSCRAGPSLRPSRKPIRFLFNYRIAQTFEQLLNEISAAVVASQCQQQVQQQHHQLNVVGAVHQVYGLATNKRINSLDDFLVDNEYVYLVYGRTERCSLVDFMLDECEQREVSAIVGKSNTNYQLPKQKLAYSNSKKAKNRQAGLESQKAIRFHLTPKQSQRQWQAEVAAAVSRNSSTTPEVVNQPKTRQNNFARDGNNNDKEELKAFSLPRNFLAHSKNIKSYHVKKSDRKVLNSDSNKVNKKDQSLEYKQRELLFTEGEQTSKSLQEPENTENRSPSSSSCFSSVYSLKEDESEASSLCLPYDDHHFLKNSTSENVLGEAFYRDQHPLSSIYSANISNSLVYDQSNHHHHQKTHPNHHFHHPQASHSQSPHSPFYDHSLENNTSSSRDRKRPKSTFSERPSSLSGSSSTTTTTTPGAASSVSCSEDFSTFATTEEDNNNLDMFSLRKGQQQTALRSEESSSSSDSSTPSFSSLSCTVRVPGTAFPSHRPHSQTPSISGHRPSSKNGSTKSSRSNSTNSTPKHQPHYSTANQKTQITPKHYSHHHYQPPLRYPVDSFDNFDEPPELEGHDNDDYDDDLPFENEPPQLPPAKRHLPLIAKREVARRYDVGEAIGDGKFGVVYTCTQRTSGRVFALKVVDKGAMQEMMAKSANPQDANKTPGSSSNQNSQTNTEAAILKRINHPNIVKIYDHLEYVDQSYLVLELFKGGDLFDAITSAGRYCEAESLEMFRDLMEALAYLHRHHIIHRDIKLENLMVAFVPVSTPPSKNTSSSRNFTGNTRNNNASSSSFSPKNEPGGGFPGRRYRQAIKLADFGLAAEILPNELLFTVCGTPTYVAPEILLEIGYTYPVDIWAAGVIAFILLCGYPPFANEENNQDLLFDQILAGKFDFDDRHWAEVSEEAKDLIRAMLSTEQSTRLSASQVLAHPWLSSSNLGKIGFR